MTRIKAYAKKWFLRIVEELWGPEAPLIERANLYSVVWWLVTLATIFRGLAYKPQTPGDFFFLLLPLGFVTFSGVLFVSCGLLYAQYNYMKNKPR